MTRSRDLANLADGTEFTAADHTKLDGIATSANNYVHPNHSGEVTSTADGATVIVDDIVDEANLKVSNTPTNGYFLSAQSGNTGGMTWAEVAQPSASDTLNTIKTVDGTGSGLDADLLDGQHGAYYAPIGSPTLTGTPAAPTASAGANSTQISTTAYVDAAISALADSAPAALNTLNELAAALGDDANYAATTTTAIGTKLAKAGGQMTGNITMSGTETVDGRDLSVDGAKLDGIEASATADQTAAQLLTAIKTVDGASSGLDADLLDGNQASAFATAAQGTLATNALPKAGGTVTGDVQFNTGANIHRGTYSSGFLVGGHNNIGSTATKTNPIYAIGTSYQPSDTSLSNMYGIGFADGSNHPISSISSVLGTGWGLYVAADGDARIGLDGSTGNIRLTGTVDGRDVAADGTKLDTIATSANNYSFPHTVSSGESASTVVQRNSSGYINTSYYNGSGTFATTGNTSGMARFTGTNGSDTYGRSYTAAAARTLLNVANGANNGASLNGDYAQNWYANDIYYDSWTRNHVNNNGLYWNNTAWHLYPKDADDFYMRAGSGSCGLQMTVGNETARGYVYADTSNRIGFLNNSRNWSFKVDSSGNATATGNVTAYSDIRLKSNIEPLINSLDTVCQLQGVKYIRKSTGKTEIGFVAQDVKKVVPELVEIVDSRTESSKGMSEGIEDLHVMKYQNTVALLVEAIKELKAEVEELKK